MEKTMNILDIFFLVNNQIIIAGNIDDAIGLIPECKCNLYCDDIFQEELLCLGENIIRKRDQNNKIRSVSIKDISKLTSQNVHVGNWRIDFLL